MDQKSQLKVIAAGFVIIRTDDSPQPKIKVKDSKSHEWHTYVTNFASKAARDRRFAELLKSKTIISD